MLLLEPNNKDKPKINKKKYMSIFEIFKSEKTHLFTYSYYLNQYISKIIKYQKKN